MIPTSSERFVQSDQIRRHRSLALRQKVFTPVELPLGTEHGQKVPEAGRVKLPGEIKRRPTIHQYFRLWSSHRNALFRANRATGACRVCGLVDHR